MTAHALRPLPAPPLAQPCRICGDIRPWHAGQRCACCAMYWYRHGTERPPVPTPRVCVVCGARLRHAWRGRCAPCYSYARKFQRERPPHLWGRPKRPGVGWRWIAGGWVPPRRYCREEADYPRKPLCGQCSNAPGCARLVQLRREIG